MEARIRERARKALARVLLEHPGHWIWREDGRVVYRMEIDDPVIQALIEIARHDRDERACPECGGPPDERVMAGMRCFRCAYGV